MMKLSVSWHIFYFYFFNGSSFFFLCRNEIPRSSYPGILGSTQSFRPDFNLADDDVLSYTSTEFEGHDLTPTSATTFPRDVLLNMNLSGE
jgi:hypothetical protein